MKTELNDRVLWFDGTSEVNPELVPELLLNGLDPQKIVVTSLNQDIQDFNLLSDEPINSIKNENEKIDLAWNIPLEYQQLDLSNYIVSRAEKMGEEYVLRAKDELDEIKTRRLGTVFKSLIYIVDELRKNKQVWGVGRGSSCASLVLHIIGIHEIDPVKFSIPKEEFFHD